MNELGQNKHRTTGRICGDRGHFIGLRLETLGGPKGRKEVLKVVSYGNHNPNQQGGGLHRQTGGSAILPGFWERAEEWFMNILKNIKRWEQKQEDQKQRRAEESRAIKKELDEAHQSIDRLDKFIMQIKKKKNVQ